jgi:type IV pilus assembly protein PilO
MNSKVEQVLELPVAHKLGILAGAVVLVFFLYWVSLYSSVASDYGKLKKDIYDIGGLDEQIMKETKIANNKEIYVAQKVELEEELKKALLQLPDKREIDILLARISDKAIGSGLIVKTFRPQPEEKREFYAAVPVELEVSGTYHQLGSFFDEIGHMERVVNIDNLSFSSSVESADKASELKVNLIATTFRFLDPEEIAALAAANDKKKK